MELLKLRGAARLTAVAFIFSAALLTSCASRNEVKSEATLTVSAAADLTPALEEIGKLFSNE